MTIQEQLADAELQYHLLLTGQKPRVYVDQNGERVEYTTTTATKLRAYIEDLKATINGTASHPGVLTGFF